MSIDAVAVSAAVRIMRGLGFDPVAIQAQFTDFMLGIKGGVDSIEARIASIERDQRAIREMLAILLSDRETPACVNEGKDQAMSSTNLDNPTDTASADAGQAADTAMRLDRMETAMGELLARLGRIESEAAALPSLKPDGLIARLDGIEGDAVAVIEELAPYAGKLAPAMDGLTAFFRHWFTKA